MILGRDDTTAIYSNNIPYFQVEDFRFAQEFTQTENSRYGNIYMLIEEWENKLQILFIKDRQKIILQR